MKKVTVPHDVADAIEYFRANNTANSRILHFALEPFIEAGEDGPHIRALRSIDEDELMQALVLGYERQKSLEEELLDYALNHEFWDGLGDLGKGFKAALEIIGRHDSKYAHVKKWAAGGFRLATDLQGVPVKPAFDPEDFILTYIDPGRIEVHHKNGGLICTLNAPPKSMLSSKWFELFWKDETNVSIVRNFAKELGLIQ